MPAFGVYPIADAKDAGDEISSTYEGRHITCLESEITHPTHTDGFVDKGDPVVIGNQIVGIALKSAAAASDLIAVDTEGIWVVDVLAQNDAGDIAVAGGDLLYINVTTCVVSKISLAAGQIPFGYALGIIAASNTDTIAVKVHFDPVEAAGLEAAQVLFTEEGAGVYTGDIAIPAGAILIDVIVFAEALWTAGTSAAMIVGDVTDPNGFFDAINLKATDLLANESISFAHTGGEEGADVDSPAAGAHVRRRRLAAARVVTGEVTSVGAGTAGRTRMTAIWFMPYSVGDAAFVAA